MNTLRTHARRWLLLTIVAIMLASAFVRLGYWQLARAHRDQHSRQSGVHQLTDVSILGQGLADSNIGATVTATGHYDLAHQFLAQRSGGQTWVVTPLLLPDGGALAVVRGLAPAAAPPPGRVVVTGVIEASEPPGSQSTRSTINTETLVAAWPYSIHDGFVVLTGQVPPSNLAAAPLPALRKPGLRTLNLIYAIQWWIFAAFAIGFLFKVVRDDVVVAQAGANDHD